MAIYGVDLHPGYQAPFDFARAKRAGYKFAFVKASEGTHYVPEGFAPYFNRGKNVGMMMGFYHFLDGNDGSGRAQADHFLNTIRKVGGARGRLLAVDFEAYGNRTPSNAQLKDFCNYVKSHTDGHKLIIYSGTAFWNGGDSSGPFTNYNADVAWEARVWTTTEKRRVAKRFYEHQWLPWYKKQHPHGLGGRAAKFRQFTWGGRVGGLYVDTDAFEGSMEDLARLTH